MRLADLKRSGQSRALVGTAHGISLSSLISNPELNSLVGGIHQVVTGDIAAMWVYLDVQDVVLCMLFYACCRMHAVVKPYPHSDHYQI